MNGKDGRNVSGGGAEWGNRTKPGRRNQGGCDHPDAAAARIPSSTMRSLATHPMSQPQGASDHLGEAFAAGPIRRLEDNVGRVLRGKPEAIRLAVVSLLAGGHLLIEDVPGVGKTTLAQALAKSLGLSFQRIQFTSDLLPSDILG